MNLKECFGLLSGNQVVIGAGVPDVLVSLFFLINALLAVWLSINFLSCQTRLVFIQLSVFVKFLTQSFFVCEIAALAVIVFSLFYCRFLP